MARGESGAIAQLGERLLCKQEVAGSIPAGSTRSSSRSRDTTPAPPRRELERVRVGQGDAGVVSRDGVRSVARSLTI